MLTVAEYLQSRLAFLTSSQNRDGGWGYLPGKQSWLEPTVYAMLALGRNSEAFGHAWELVHRWQLPDGGWRPCAEFPRPHWTAALCVTLHSVAGVTDTAFERAVQWLLETRGAEQRPLMRLAKLIDPHAVEFDPSLTGWPWLPGTASWIEPTTHTLIALKRASRHVTGGALAARIGLGERMILDRRCRDGGWNYGNRRVLETDLFSYAESTAMALVALRGSQAPGLEPSLALARQYRSRSRSRFAQAWLRMCLDQWGIAQDPPREDETDCGNDIALSALEALACQRIPV